MLHPEYSYIIVSFSILLLFVFSSCVSDEITMEMVHNPEPEIEKTVYKYLLEIDVVVQLIRREFAMKYLISVALKYDSLLGFSSITIRKKIPPIGGIIQIYASPGGPKLSGIGGCS